MFDAQHSKRPESDHGQMPSEQKAANPKQGRTQQAGDLTRIPVYAQAWGNLPPPWLRLPVQRKELHGKGLVQERDEPLTQHKENATGLPDALKAGVEHLSGVSLDDVHVHYYSAKPAEVQALAYTQGTDIHVGSGQEKHLAHEAWHVVQQKQGRVKPTIQTRNVVINDEQALEREADMMGEKAHQIGSGSVQRKVVSDVGSVENNSTLTLLTQLHFGRGAVIQRRLVIEKGLYAGVYGEVGDIKLLLDGIATVINLKYPNDKVKRGPLPFVKAKGKYTVNTIDDLIAYMIDLAASKPTMHMALDYGADHGDYHFTGKVTPSKAQWTISKKDALTLMMDAITGHMEVLLEMSKDEGWTPWYIGADAGKKIGETVQGNESSFTIQLQVNKEHNIISYHGYPDQRLQKFGVGKTKTALE